MKTKLLSMFALAISSLGMVSCIDVPGGGYPPYRGGYGGGYDDGYRRDYHHETHCYCSHKSCGCKPGHPRGGCDCDHGSHRH